MSDTTPRSFSGTGYVAGRTAAPDRGTPAVRIGKASCPTSQPGAPVAAAFPHLQGAYPELKFAGLDDSSP